MVDNLPGVEKKDVCHSPLMLIAEEPNIHLIPISLHDLGWPVAKSFHAGPYQLMSGSLFNTGGSNLFRDTHTDRQTRLAQGVCSSQRARRQCFCPYSHKGSRTSYPAVHWRGRNSFYTKATRSARKESTERKSEGNGLRS